MVIINLFSIFDPYSSVGGSLNWIRLWLGVLLLPIGKGLLKSRYQLGLHRITKVLTGEVASLIRKKDFIIILIFISLIGVILLNNLLGIAPYIFTATRHLVITLRLGLPLWCGYILFWGFIFPKRLIAHLVPQGTPYALIAFIVVIERVRRIIRPMTLAVRLAANIIAGHLLLSLLRRRVRVFLMVVPFRLVLAQVLLVVLEVAVAVIQSYVYMVLIVLYVREV